jgi:DNA-directed RNA polymerase I, II, and III subunit RPABC1
MSNNIRNTCIEMLIQRGYNIVEQDEQKIIGEMDIDKICIFLVVSAKLNINKIQEYIGMSDMLRIKHCVIIYRDGVTPVANKIVNNSIEIEIELFNQEELSYNITKHSLVPEHIKLSGIEAQTIIDKYGKKLPIMFTVDAISRFYRYKDGDIVKIIRRNKFIGYRIVKCKN